MNLDIGSSPSEDHTDLAVRVLGCPGGPDEVADRMECTPAEVVAIREAAGLDSEGQPTPHPDPTDSDYFEDDAPEWEQDLPLERPKRSTEPTPEIQAVLNRRTTINARERELREEGVPPADAWTQAVAELRDEDRKQERAERDARNRARREEDDPTGTADWNRKLSESAGDAKERWGLKDLDTGQTYRPDHIPELGRVKKSAQRRAGVKGKEAFGLAEEIFGTSEGTGADGEHTRSILIDEAPPSGVGRGNRSATGRSEAPRNAVKVTHPDGSTSLFAIGNDVDAIRQALSDKDYSPAVARRRSEAANTLRIELGQKVATFLDQGATQKAVAEAIGCTERTVRTLRDEAKA